MDEDKVLSLFDFYWFDRRILTKQLFFPTEIDSSPPKIETQMEIPQVSENPPKISPSRSLLYRSHSDQLSSQLESISKNSMLERHKLETILSGKEAGEPPAREIAEQEKEKPSTKRRGWKKKKKNGSKSLSDLEFEELKGFMDLGFTFTESEIDSGLISIIPGLQRLGKKEGEDEEREAKKSGVPRPYLSEAWGVREKDYDPVMYWSIPASGDGNDMKDHLKFWAHAVASSVR